MRRVAISLFCGGAFALLPLTEAGASAGTIHETLVSPSGVHTTIGTQQIQAGYLAFPTGSSASYSATFKVPRSKCTSGTTGFLAVHAVLNGTNGMTATGSGATVFTDCSGTKANYSAQLFVDDVNGPSEAVAPGQAITVSGSSGPGGESYTLSDTKAGTLTDSGPGFAVDDVQVTEQGTGTFPRFMPLTFSDLSVDGSAFGAASDMGFNEVDPSNKIEIKISGIKNGTSFTEKYVSNT